MECTNPKFFGCVAVINICTSEDHDVSLCGIVIQTRKGEMLAMRSIRSNANNHFKKFMFTS